MKSLQHNKLETQQRHYQLVANALRFIDQHQGEQPELAAIAKHCAISEYHFQRVFTEWAGVSPKQFLQYLTREQARSRLLDGASLLKAAGDSGLSSSSRLHDLFVSLDAVTPGEIKNGGNGITFIYGVHPSPFGLCFIALTERGIHRLDFIEQPQDIEYLLEALQRQWPLAILEENQASSAIVVTQVFSKSPRPLSSPLKLWVNGTQFQFKVWEALLRIPSGAVASYAEVAKAINQPTAARAVGSAVGKNPIALLIPCHRVIQGMGELGHYRWNPIRKKAMLGWEASLKVDEC
ncbi:bifunctional transcriptional activator/DNA repair enzyme AdaA [Oceanicoccus sp. KOV_DT_Chl]|uniref:bifunctional transcriptional activator/DNA repair enzyme AdaA n=1 Tax=Oceanicoccus sp. KOV_DT_Chl TaxID=1904639 RepID=UPI000C7A5E22|nr:methylated-DNA--[protein]-cysteine S-methyltransferase [Oceanicoccus sp. KOV_DT_Chl]